MKKLIYLVVFSCSAVFSQGTLEKLYYMVPNESCDDLSLTERKERVAMLKKQEISGKFDEKNGYMEDFSSSQNGFKMCYWKWYYPKDSVTAHYIVGVNGGEPSLNYFDFFMEEKGKLIPFRPTPLNYFNAVYFFKEDVSIAKIKPFLSNFWLELPSKGTSLVIHFGWGGLGEGDEDNPANTEKKMLKGDKIDLIWNKGDFKLGEPYF
jgi:hypothetical protein